VPMLFTLYNFLSISTNHRQFRTVRVLLALVMEHNNVVLRIISVNRLWNTVELVVNPVLVIVRRIPVLVVLPVGIAVRMDSVLLNMVIVGLRWSIAELAVNMAMEIVRKGSSFRKQFLNT
jgi:hypothetical protein